jgi:PcfJ-like protein
MRIAQRTNTRRPVRTLNGHRPKLREQPSQRYLAGRPHTPSGAERDARHEARCWDELWEDEDAHPWSWCPCCPLLDSTETWRAFRENQQLDAIWTVLEYGLPGTIRRAMGVIAPSATGVGGAVGCSPLEVVLAAFQDFVTVDLVVLDSWFTPAEKAAWRSLTARLANEAPDPRLGCSGTPTLRRFLARLLLLRPVWVRPLDGWVPPAPCEGHWTVSLAEHLLCAYDAPGFLRLELPFANRKQMLWFVLLGKGIGLRAAAKLCGWRIFRGFERHLYAVPHDESFAGGCLWADVTCRGGGEREFRAIAGFFGELDVTQRELPAATLDFIAAAVTWLPRLNATMPLMQRISVLAWAWHEHVNKQDRAERYSWHRDTVASVLRRVAANVERRDRNQTTLRWSSLGFGGTIANDGGGATWSFEELTSAEQLREEGLAMRHCVATYAQQCVQGTTVIVSATRDGRRVLTIQVDMLRGAIAQVKGTANRSATLDETAAVDRWYRRWRDERRLPRDG